MEITRIRRSGSFTTYFPAAERSGTRQAGSDRSGRRLPVPASLSIYDEGAEVVGDPGSTDQVAVMRISPVFFATLGVNLAMGRTFTEEEAAVAKKTGSLS